MCFTADEKKALAAKLGKPEATDDKELLADLVTNWNAANAAKATAEAQVTALSAQLEAANGQVLALSGNAPREPDPMSLALITRAFKTDRERVIESGVVSEAGMNELDALLLPNGKPTGAALALSAGSVDPFYSRVCDVLRRNPGVKTNNAVPRGEPGTPPTHPALPPLSGAGHQQQGLTPEQQAEVDRSLAATELGRRALAAKQLQKQTGAAA